MRDERGSLSVLGLFLTLGLLLLVAVTTSASSLYLQQRQLNNLSDFLALDLADYLQTADEAATTQIAVQELEVLNVTGRDTAIEAVTIDAPKVSVSLCQEPVLYFNLGSVLGRVCVTSAATAY